MRRRRRTHERLMPVRLELSALGTASVAPGGACWLVVLGLCVEFRVSAVGLLAEQRDNENEQTVELFLVGGVSGAC